MKNILSFCALVLFVSQTAFAADAPPFFKIEKDGQTSYILSYLPNGLTELERIPMELAQYYKESKTYVMETNPQASEEDLAVIKPILDKTMDDSLRKLMTAKEWEIFLSHVLTDDLQANAKLLDNLTNLSLFHAVNSLKTPAAAQAKNKTEEIMFAQARENKKPVMVFESVADTVSMIARVNTAEYLKALLQRNQAQWDGAQAAFDAMVEAYWAGDVKAFNQAVINLYSTNEYEILVNERSTDWAQKFDSTFQPEGEEFYLMPADLLLSPQGLLVKLEAKGYKVTAWDYAAPLVEDDKSTQPVKPVPTTPVASGEVKSSEQPSAATPMSAGVGQLGRPPLL